MAGVGGWLAVHRLFQVDEVQQMHMAWLLTRADASQFYINAEIQLIPLALLSRCFHDPVAYMTACRLLFLAVFGTSLAVLSCAVSDGRRVRTAGALLLLAATPILWDYGFEVRHDNVVILGLSLLIFFLLRRRPAAGAARLALAGAIGVSLQFASHKSLVLWGPLLIALMVEHVIADGMPFRRAAGASAAGGIAAGLCAFAAHALMGSWRMFVGDARNFLSALHAGAVRFFDGAYTLRFIGVHPWMAAAVVLFLAWKGAPMARRLFARDPSRFRDPDLKCLLLLLTALVFLALNPTPFPYNYMYVAVLAFPAAFRVTCEILPLAPMRRGLVLAALMLLQGFPGALQIQRHFHYSNDVQRRIIAFVNAYTDPEDCVFDGAGLAMFRRGPGRMWYLHSLQEQGYRTGELPQVRDMLTQHPCPVLIQSYKWFYMLPEDFAFIGSRYVEFHQVLWILGCHIPAAESGPRPFEIHQEGFYRVEPENPKTTSLLLVDGAPAGEAPVHLQPGSHVLDSPAPSGPVNVRWVKGPGASDIPIPQVAQPVFWNWY